MRISITKMVLASVIILTIVMSIYGCTEGEKNIDANKEAVITDEIDSNEISSSENSGEGNIEVKENIEEAISEVDDNTEKFTLYTIDVNTDEKVILENIELNKSLSIEEKLVFLANKITEDVFHKLPLNLVEIKDVDGKKVAVFNFEEVGENADKNTLYQDYQGSSWFQHFQGSAGGRITGYTLLESLLQRNYQGQWIDGIEFTYKGEPIDFQHAPELSGIIYR